MKSNDYLNQSIMPKRMTDTAKWDKKWFRVLPALQKLFWIYICDRCDQAGVWEGDFETASYFLGGTVTEKDLKVYGDRIIKIDETKYWLTTFIDFQCVTLSRSSPAHAPIFKLIEKHKIPYKVTDEAPLKKDDVAYEIFNDERWVEIQSLNHGNIPVQQIKDQWELCYQWHIQKPNPPVRVWEWRQKLITWLNIHEKQATNGKGKSRQQQTTEGLAEDFIQRNGPTITGNAMEGGKRKPS
jgi:hypothetical protein